MLSAMLSAGGAAAVAGPEREDELRAALVRRSPAAAAPTVATRSPTSGRS